MGSTVTLKFAFCGHQLPKLTKGPDGGAEAKNVTVESCCSKACCITAVAPLKDAQEKASLDMMDWRLWTNPGLVTGESLRDVSDNSKKAVDNANKDEMSSEMAALNAERARHETCDVIRQKAMAED